MSAVASIGEIVQGMREALADPTQDDEVLYLAAYDIDESLLSLDERELRHTYLTDPRLTGENA